ncbi:MAG: Ig-like domain-containing protein [Candidatus Marinimicrobia bacterium]|nr:Ig-like domain-containing protein [Candidatus Neomarinimicrobiota bacterium]
MFNVIDTTVTQVWPYRMVLIQDTDVIYVDGGATKSTFSITLMNYGYQPLEGLVVQVSANPDTVGLLESGYIVTDSTGKGTVIFTDTGDPDAIGTVDIVTSFTHPVFGTTSRSKQVSVIVQEDQTVVNLSLTAQPVVGPNNNFVIVGEDVNDEAPFANEQVWTRITASVTDGDGNPVSGKLIDFIAIFGSDTTENNFDLEYVTSDAQGLAWVKFEDNGQSAIDNIGTPTYEGVTVVGFIDEVVATARFNVYDQVSDIWPYRLNLYKDRDFINLDNGLTKAEITAVLSNRLNKPLKNVEITFSADLGFINDVTQTDTTGTAIEYFTDLGDPDDVGISTITANYQHPSFGLVTDSLQISIIDPTTSGIPAYIVIPASHPGDIMVTGGGGLESTNICAEVYDENGLLVDIPTEVTFELGPATPQGAAFSNGLDTIITTSTDGIACVSLNSGTYPGPVYIIATVNDTISATGIPVIIVTGPAFNIFPDLDATSTTPIGGGFYQMEAAALVYDLHGNPVADTTYVYWSIDVAPQDANDTLDAEIIGVSFTNNENINLDHYPGLAFTKLIYPSRGIFDWARIKAYTYGAGGVIVIDSVENDAIMAYYEGDGGSLELISTVTYWDFSTMTNPATTQLIATLTDHYGNPVENGRIQFTAPAGTIFGANPALTDENGQAGVVVQWDIGVCNPIPGSDPQQYNSFTSSCIAILLDPMPTTSDPVDVLLVRTYQLPNPPTNGADDSTK